MIVRKFAKAAVMVVTLTVAAIVLSASPAAADGDHSGRAYVHFVDRWWDEGDLSQSHHAHSNATCLWQKILWADDKLTDEREIDGIFGDKTAAATKKWKEDEDLPADGTVGINAFRKADFWLVDAAGGGYWYIGSARNIRITVDGAGRMGFYDDDVHRLAGYNFRTCS